jgi:hypothetical protein
MSCVLERRLWPRRPACRVGQDGGKPGAVPTGGDEQQVGRASSRVLSGRIVSTRAAARPSSFKGSTVWTHSCTPRVTPRAEWSGTVARVAPRGELPCVGPAAAWLVALSVSCGSLKEVAVPREAWDRGVFGADASEKWTYCNSSR